MPDELAKLEEILKQANLAFERTIYEEGISLVSAVIDADADLRLDVIAYRDVDGYELKMVIYIDEIDEDAAADQLRAILELNFVMALGRFAYQKDIDAIVYVADYPLALLDVETFRSIVDEYLHFSNLYFENRYGEPGPEFAGHD